VNVAKLMNGVTPGVAFLNVMFAGTDCSAAAAWTGAGAPPQHAAIARKRTPDPRAREPVFFFIL
jgi:hypothetical protein